MESGQFAGAYSVPNASNGHFATSGPLIEVPRLPIVEGKENNNKKCRDREKLRKVETLKLHTLFKDKFSYVF